MARKELEDALRDGASPAHLKRALAAELARSRKELELPRSGYGKPVTVAVAPGVVVLPVAVAYRADPGKVPARARRLVDVLLELLDPASAGEHDGCLALASDEQDALGVGELFDEAVRGVDRLKAAALVVPAAILDVRDLRPLPREDPGEEFPIAHDDPDPARRAARRILQRLNGMGKWGGYHTEFAHLARGFQGNDAARALEVGEALLAAGLLTEKPSVGQRHVSLNSRRAGEIHRLIETGHMPDGLHLP
jgi:hypothetical protein